MSQAKPTTVPLPAPSPKSDWLTAEEVTRLPGWFIEHIELDMGRFGERLIIVGRATEDSDEIFRFSLPANSARKNWADQVLVHTKQGYLVGPCQLRRDGRAYMIVSAEQSS
jgi:hypothetical protein